MKGLGGKLAKAHLFSVESLDVVISDVISLSRSFLSQQNAFVFNYKSAERTIHEASMSRLNLLDQLPDFWPRKVDDRGWDLVHRVHLSQVYSLKDQTKSCSYCNILLSPTPPPACASGLNRQTDKMP